MAENIPLTRSGQLEGDMSHSQDKLRDRLNKYKKSTSRECADCNAKVVCAMSYLV